MLCSKIDETRKDETDFFFVIMVSLGSICVDVLRRMIGNGMRETRIDFLLRFKTVWLSQSTHKSVSHSNKESRNP